MSHHTSVDLHIDEHVLQLFKPVKKIAKGQYGIVWRAKDLNTNQFLALKKIYNAFQSEVDAQRTYREINYLERLSLPPSSLSSSSPSNLPPHPNIIFLHKVLPSDNGLDIYLVFEYMETDLREVLKKRLLKQTHFPYIIFQLLHALQYIHSASLIHRDISPSNILLNASCQVKLADFGLCRSLPTSNSGVESSRNEEANLTDYIAVRWYRSPEVLLSGPYSFGLDIWSAGCVFAEMLSSEHQTLFPGNNTVDQLHKIFSFLSFPDSTYFTSLFGNSVPSPTQDLIKQVQDLGFQNDTASPNDRFRTRFPDLEGPMVTLLTQLLALDPSKRITARAALTNETFSEFQEENKKLLEYSFSEPLRLPFQDNIRHPAEKYREILFKKYEVEIPTKEENPEIKKMLAHVHEQLNELETTEDVERVGYQLIQKITQIVEMRKTTIC